MRKAENRLRWLRKNFIESQTVTFPARNSVKFQRGDSIFREVTISHPARSGDAHVVGPGLARRRIVRRRRDLYVGVLLVDAVESAGF